MSGLPDKICARCGLNMERVGGFTRARDFTAFLAGETKTIPEYCTHCILVVNGQFPLTEIMPVPTEDRP